jgi:N utilization substance protein B
MNAARAKPRAAGGGRRSLARLAAVQALYQIDLANGAAEAVVQEFVRHRLGQVIEGAQYRDADVEWFGDVVRGATARQAEVDALIEAAIASGRGLDRVETLLRATLRAGAYELLARVDVPARVVIDEYVDVANAFFSGPEPKLVNGVLDHIARQVRPGELTESGGGGPQAPG